MESSSVRAGLSPFLFQRALSSNAKPEKKEEASAERAESNTLDRVQVQTDKERRESGGTIAIA